MITYMATIITDAGKDAEGNHLVREAGFVLVRANTSVEARNRAGKVATEAKLRFSYMDIQRYSGGCSWPHDFNRFVPLRDRRSGIV